MHQIFEFPAFYIDNNTRIYLIMNYLFLYC